jgi:hypothetical protein
VTATITDHLGQRVSGEIRCWMGRRIVEVETPDGTRHIGRLTPDPEPAPGCSRRAARRVHSGRCRVSLTITDLFRGTSPSHGMRR